MEIQTKRVRANGLSFRVCDAGGGEPVVLLHGYPDSLLLWRKIIPGLLQRGHRVIAYDQRGFGETDAPEGVDQYKIHHMVADLRAILEALAVQGPVKLIGHDWGAIVGWAAAIRHPALFSSYVAVSVGHPTAYYKEGGFEQEKKRWYAMLYLFRGFAETMFSQHDWAALRLSFQNHSELDKHWIPDLSREGRFTAALNWYRANVQDGIEAQSPAPPCKVPTLGIFSDRDSALSEAQMTRSQYHMDAPWQYVKIKSCGHHIPLDKPQALLDVIFEYYGRP